ncbi:MAG: 16S rRNA (guanine(527)-N(7))-methyltransferase RsmG [Defluviitaleaceae bacterium]|nr:16S rRNA (guanine(527)-N(7))-methyltransferase RsmG [Defluviitaleaceae bacterium]
MQKNLILDWARHQGFAISDAQLDTLEAYQNQVLKVNRHMNLTAITDDSDFAIKHIIDSLTLLPFIGENASVIDIGTGAGFPGLVLRIMREDIKLTLLDSLLKRVNFLRETAEMLGFPETECIHARAEEFSKKRPAAYDICTARAVASLDKLAAYALPLVKKGGAFLAMKGPDVFAELEKAKPAIKKYGGLVKNVHITEIAEGVRHSIVIIKAFSNK